MLPVIIFVILGFIFMQLLLHRKAGHLVLTTDVTQKQKATINKKDADVVVDLLGLWFTDKRYVDVIHICERLLERDPSNNVVRLFKAKAMDKLDDKDTYKGILNTVVKTEDDLSANDKNIISKHLTEKDQMREVKKMIKGQLEKEGKKFVDPEKKEKKEVKKVEKPKDNVLEDYTGKGNFKIGA